MVFRRAVEVVIEVFKWSLLNGNTRICNFT